MSSQPQNAALDLAAGRKVVFRPRRLTFGNVFLAVWLGFWAFANAKLLEHALRDGMALPPVGLALLGMVAFFVVWGLLWGGGGIVAWIVFAFSVAGRETAAIAESRLFVRRSVAAIGRTRTFDLASIRDIRTLPDYWEGHRVAFSYQGKTVRLGRRLDAAAADALGEALRRQLPPQEPLAPPERALRKLTLTGSVLELRRGSARIGVTRRYDRALVRNVRATPVLDEDGDPSDEDFEIAFDYGRRTVRFGGKLTIGEAEALAQHLREQLLVNVV